jgi:hypothetical protein
LIIIRMTTASSTTRTRFPLIIEVIGRSVPLVQ